jgi:hypothetical protein
MGIGRIKNNFIDCCGLFYTDVFLLVQSYKIKELYGLKF